MCFVWIAEQTAIISLYNTNWLVFITETECVYCAVRTGSLYTILRSAHTVSLCVLCGSENKQRLFPYTALTGWVCITETECVYCAVRTEHLIAVRIHFLVWSVNFVCSMCRKCSSRNARISESLYKIMWMYVTEVALVEE